MDMNSVGYGLCHMNMSTTAASSAMTTTTMMTTTTSSYRRPSTTTSTATTTTAVRVGANRQTNILTDRCWLDCKLNNNYVSNPACLMDCFPSGPDIARLSLVQLLYYCALIGRELHIVDPTARLCQEA